MKIKASKRPVLPILMCIILCVGLAMALSVRAFAAESAAPAANISIEILPPIGSANESAVVGYSIADKTGNGFKSAKVKRGQDGKWLDVTSSLERWENCYIGQLTLTDNCAVTVSVTGQDGAVYEKMRYIDCFENGTQLYLSDLMVREDGNQTQAPTVDAMPSASVPPVVSVAPENTNGAAVVHPVDASASDDPDAEPDTSARPTTLTPDGQGTVLDDVSGEENKEFLTIKTPDENIFYLIIDKQRDGKNVYFLNTVTESDLAALAVKDQEPASTSAVPDPEPVCSCKDKCEAGAVNTDCPVCVLNLQDCKGVAPAVEDEPQPKKPEEDGNVGLIVVVLLVALAVGVAGWYFKIYKPKHDMDDAEDIEALTGEAEEETVNEDNQPEIRVPQEPGDRRQYRPDYEDYTPVRHRPPEDDEPDEPPEPRRQDYDDEPGDY